MLHNYSAQQLFVAHVNSHSIIRFYHTESHSSIHTIVHKYTEGSPHATVVEICTKQTIYRRSRPTLQQVFISDHPNVLNAPVSWQPVHLSRYASLVVLLAVNAALQLYLLSTFQCLVATLNNSTSGCFYSTRAHVSCFRLPLLHEIDTNVTLFSIDTLLRL